MGYNLINWENSPSKQTPINAENLNQMDVNIAKAIQGTRFNFSATFTSDGVLKNTTSTEALSTGSFATSQTDIVTVFVADNVTKINSGAFSNCTSLKTIYIDNTVGNVEIVSGAIPDGVSIVYSNDDNFINVNELLASAIKSLKKQVNADKSDWENRATSIEAQHKTDVQALTDKANSIVEQANTDRQNFNNSVDEINTKLETPLADIEILKAEKLDKADFNAYKIATNKAVKDNADNIKLLDTKVIDNTEAITQNTADIDELKVKSLPSVKLTLPNSITEISDLAFCANQSLTSVTIGKSVTNIGVGAFQNCTSLASVTIPNSVTRIGDRAFRNCRSLTSVTIPNSVTRIGDWVFYNCTSLASVTIENGFNANGLDLSYSTKYTADTIVSWLNALADRTGQTAYTLIIGETNKEKLTTEQLAIATNKNWNIA